MNIDNVLITMFLLASEQEEKNEVDPKLKEILDKDFLVNVLSKKLKWANVPVTVDETVLGIISICARGNPGMAQLILHDILSDHPDAKRISLSHYVGTFPDQHPIIYEDNGDLTPIGLSYEKDWDKQKIHDAPNHTDNKVDTKEYWLEIYKNQEDIENGDDQSGSN